MSNPDRELFAIGEVVKAVGVKGEVVLRSMTGTPERFKKLRSMFVGRTPGTAAPATAERVQAGHRGVRLKVKGIDDRDGAERLVGALVFVDAANRAPLRRGSYYVHDIIGLGVVDEAGNTLGVVRDVLKLPSNDVYVIDASGRELMLPAVKEFVRSIDMTAKVMTVRLIEGMEL